MNRIIFLPLLLIFNFSNAQFLMFPGDTNNDSIANNYDILPIGLAYGAEGEPRIDQSIDWLPHEFFPWFINLPFSGVDYGFIDCDGNGFIDSLDVEAIAHNYDQVQFEANPPPMPYDLPDTLFTTNIPQLVVSFDLDTAMVMDTFFAQIELIYADTGDIEPALGIAFGLEYDADLVKDSLTVIFPDTMPDDLMFVHAASNFVGFHRAPAEGRVEVGAAGRGQNVISGPRPVAKVRFIVEDQIIRSVERDFSFHFTDVLMINNEERVLNVGTFSDTILLIDVTPVYEINLENEIQVFPNPSNSNLYFEAESLVFQSIQIFNQLGQLVESKYISDLQKTQINIANLPHGIYFTKIHTDKGILTKKVIFF